MYAACVGTPWCPKAEEAYHLSTLPFDSLKLTGGPLLDVEVAKTAATTALPARPGRVAMRGSAGLTRPEDLLKGGHRAAFLDWKLIQTLKS